MHGSRTQGEDEGRKGRGGSSSTALPTQELGQEKAAMHLLLRVTFPEAGQNSSVASSGTLCWAWGNRDGDPCPCGADCLLGDVSRETTLLTRLLPNDCIRHKGHRDPEVWSGYVQGGFPASLPRSS